MERKMSELSYKAHLFVCLWYLSIITLARLVRTSGFTVQRWRQTQVIACAALLAIRLVKTPLGEQQVLIKCVL